MTAKEKSKAKAKAKPFRFRENRVPLDMNGHIIALPAERLHEKIKSSTENEIPTCSALLQKGDTAENVEECTKILEAWFEELLGKTVYEKIFGDKKRTFFDCCDAYRYVCEAARDYFAEIAEKGKVLPDEPSDK